MEGWAVSGVRDSGRVTIEACRTINTEVLAGVGLVGAGVTADGLGGVWRTIVPLGALVLRGVGYSDVCDPWAVESRHTLVRYVIQAGHSAIVT